MLRFRCDQTASVGLSSGSAGGQLDDVEPVLGGDQLPHRGADVRGEVVPDQHDRAAESLVRGVEQADAAGFGEAASFAFASIVDSGGVDQSAAPVGFDADEAGDRDPPGSLAGHRDHRGVAATSPGAGLRWLRRLTCLVLETDPGVALRRHRFPVGHTSCRQVAIASSSRSTARCAGICTDQPIRCSRNAVPRSV